MKRQHRAYQTRAGRTQRADDIPTTGHLITAACDAFFARRGMETLKGFSFGKPSTAEKPHRPY